MTIWHLADQPFTARSSTVAARHVCRSTGFVNKDEPFRIKSCLSLAPGLTRRSDVWSVLFGRVQAFF